MNKDFARHMSAVAWRSSGLLGNLMPLLREHCDPGEYESMRRAIAGLIGQIHDVILSRVYETHPEIEAEVKAKVERFGHVI